MNIREQVNSLLLELGQRYGERALALNNQSQCALRLDTGMCIVLEVLEGRNQCMLFSAIAPLVSSGKDRESQLLAACQINFSGLCLSGASLSVDDDATLICLSTCIEMSEMCYPEFEKWLLTFVRDLKNIQHIMLEGNEKNHSLTKDLKSNSTLVHAIRI